MTARKIGVEEDGNIVSNTYNFPPSAPLLSQGERAAIDPNIIVITREIMSTTRYGRYVLIVL